MTNQFLRIRLHCGPSIYPLKFWGRDPAFSLQCRCVQCNAREWSSHTEGGQCRAWLRTYWNDRSVARAHGMRPRDLLTCAWRLARGSCVAACRTFQGLENTSAATCHICTQRNNVGFSSLWTKYNYVIACSVQMGRNELGWTQLKSQFSSVALHGWTIGLQRERTGSSVHAIHFSSLRSLCTRLKFSKCSFCLCSFLPF